MSDEPIPTFSLIDHDGHRVDERSYGGKHLVVFFGFTHCRMVCPRALGRLNAALEPMGPEADRYQALYITVDPDRDDPPRMKSFLGDYPRFVGLTGTAGEVDEAKASFNVFARQAPDPDDPEGYLMPHTAITYLVNPDGGLAAHFGDATETHEVLDTLRSALAR